VDYLYFSVTLPDGISSIVDVDVAVVAVAGHDLKSNP
jgi:hypothetical protein